jgi:hypothetical protein
LEKVILYKRRRRIERKEAFDSSRYIQATEIEVGDIVLKYNTKKELDRSTKQKLVYK